MTNQFIKGSESAFLKVKNPRVHKDSSRADLKGRVERHFRTISSVMPISPICGSPAHQITVDDCRKALLDFVVEYHVKVMSPGKKSGLGVSSS